MSNEQRAFTVKADGGRLLVVKTKVGISVVTTEEQKQESQITEVEAIWDTGATNSAISSSIAKKLNLTPSNYTNVNTGGNKIEKAPVYYVNLLLPNHMTVLSVQVTELPGLADGDMLVGMDIITLGDFTITNLEGITWCSFRMPSQLRTDFVTEANIFNRKLAIGINTSKKQKGKKVKRKNK